MLKKTGLTLIFTLILIFTIASMAWADSSDDTSTFYIYGSIGYKEPMFNFSGAVRFGHFGVEVGAGYRLYPGMLDYPCPHYDYTIIDYDYLSSLVGVDLIHYIDLADNVSIYAGGGLYLMEYDTVVESNSTYWVYRQYTRYEGRFAYSGGLQIHQNGIGIGIGYHSLRGVNLQMLFKL